MTMNEPAVRFQLSHGQTTHPMVKGTDLELANNGLEEDSQGNTPVALHTRRGFITEVGTKAMYVTPVFMTLAASQAIAQTGSCFGLGYPCSNASECCEYLGDPLDCAASEEGDMNCLPRGRGGGSVSTVLFVR